MRLKITATIVSILINYLFYAQTLLVNYPLTTNLNPIAGGFGPMTVSGPLTLPPSAICQTTPYPDGVLTPNIGTINTNSFQVEIEFNLNSLPSTVNGRSVIVGGSGWRWIGVHVNNTGKVGVLYNNSNFIWSAGSIIAPPTWYQVKLQYDNTHVVLYINNVLVIDQCIPLLVTGNNLNFCTSNYSNGAALNGCIRNLKLSNNPIIVTPPCIIPLPTELLTFDAKVENHSEVGLLWEIEQENNIAYFTLHRSNDMMNWEQLETVYNEFNEVNYHKRDLDPSLGISYYKLNSYDLNAVKGAELIRSVEIDQAAGFYLAPNPASDYLFVHYTKIDNQIIRIYSIDGKEVENFSMEENKEGSLINISALIPGYYMVIINNESLRFVKV